MRITNRVMNNNLLLNQPCLQRLDRINNAIQETDQVPLTIL